MFASCLIFLTIYSRDGQTKLFEMRGSLKIHPILGGKASLSVKLHSFSSHVNQQFSFHISKQNHIIKHDGNYISQVQTKSMFWFPVVPILLLFYALVNLFTLFLINRSLWQRNHLNKVFISCRYLTGWDQTCSQSSCVWRKVLSEPKWRQMVKISDDNQLVWG